MLSGLSSAAVSINSSECRFRDSRWVARTRSVVASPRPPSSRSVSRNARWVYPASGARKYREGITREPSLNGGSVKETGGGDRRETASVLISKMAEDHSCGGGGRTASILSQLGPAWQCAPP